MEELKPAFEVRRREGALGVDQLVGSQWTPGVARQAEEQPAPEGGQLGQVLGPIDPGDVVEHRPEDVVLGHVAVEATHHLGHLGCVIEIPARWPGSETVEHHLLLAHEYAGRYFCQLSLVLEPSQSAERSENSGAEEWRAALRKL